MLTTFLNMLRFVAWQNLALLPLLSAAVAVAVRNRGLPAVLLVGIALWLTFITIVIPFQGHGWGYRYLHPYLGSFALLAGYGYQELRRVIGEWADRFVLTLSAVTAAATIPLLLIAAHRFVEPYIAVDKLVAMQRTPMVLIDTYARPTNDGQWAGNAIENVRNLPDLGNRPLRISSVHMSPDLLAGLCNRGRITVITRADQRRAGFASNAPEPNRLFGRLADSVQKKAPDCLVPASASISSRIPPAILRDRHAL